MTAVDRGAFVHAGNMGSASRTVQLEQLAEAPEQDRLLRVEAVLRLVPDQRLRAVDHLGASLPRRDARAGSGGTSRRAWPAPSAPRRPGYGVIAASLVVGMRLAHRDPGVGDDDVRARRPPRARSRDDATRAPCARARRSPSSGSIALRARRATSNCISPAASMIECSTLLPSPSQATLRPGSALAAAR